MPRIIVVDDDPIILRFAATYLRNAGFDVVTSSNPLILAMDVGTHQPDLVLLDVEMPAIRGTQVLAALRRTSCHNRVKIVLFSSLADEVLTRLSNEFSATGWIRKASPLNGPALVTRVREFLAESEAEEADEAPVALVMDDSRAMRRILTGALTERGFSVLHAGNGEELQAILTQRPKIEVVLTDVNMPGVEGVSLLRTLRMDAATREARIMLVTCESDLDLIDRMIRAGASSCLRKPFTRTELSLALDELVMPDRATG